MDRLQKKEERQERILALLQDGKRVTVESIATLMDISAITIRRDLTELQDRGLVTRSYGGVRLRTPEDEPAARKPGVEERLGEAAARLLPEEGTIYLDGSGPCLGLIPRLEGRGNLRVLTDSLRAAEELSRLGLTVFCTGGTLSRDTLCFQGPEAEDMVRRYCIDAAFFEPLVFTRQGLVAESSPERGALLRRVLERAGKKYALCRRSCFGQHSAPFALMETRDLDALVSETALPGWLDTGDALRIVIYTQNSQNSLMGTRYPPADTPG